MPAAPSEEQLDEQAPEDMVSEGSPIEQPVEQPDGGPPG
jgi:hypothetical protein